MPLFYQILYYRPGSLYGVVDVTLWDRFNVLRVRDLHVAGQRLEHQPTVVTYLRHV